MAYSASDISKAVFLAIIFVITVLGNALVAYVLIKCRKQLLKNRPTYQFILNIVLSDLIVGIVIIPCEFTAALLEEWIFGTALCKIIEFIEIAVSGTAVCTHALIAFDRFRSLARPYLPKMEGRIVRQMITLSWLVPAIISSPYLYMFEVQEIDSTMVCTPNAIPIDWLDKLYEAIEFVAVLLIPFVVLCWCYFHVTLIMWGRSPLVGVENFPAAPHSVISQNKKRVTRTSGLVAAAFIVCWLPTFVLSIVRIVSGTGSVHRRHVLHEISMFGTFINEAINPIIYCAFDRSLKARIRLHAICTLHTESAGSTQYADQTYTNTATQYSAAEHSRKKMVLRTLNLNFELKSEGQIQPGMAQTYLQSGSVPNDKS
ncbi:Neuropeptide FF receptor 2 [Desmophyllum pertusum]|uniref:Neuropeptide FF receptor 2 n=1 Tax=Desmophyllum pertusum TaxID=174260 RepID=A0A9W9YRI2_9CNID|nr:Neuropeptide FF receptor 2 [Desmophyllum pertusum]